ncbi:MAG: hypothetical protein ACRDWA_04715 [Acidimicrobiia bacterium]
MISLHVQVEPKERVDEIVLDNADTQVSGDLRVVDMDVGQNSQSLQPVPAAMGTWGSEEGVVVLTNTPSKALSLCVPDVENRVAGKPPPREMIGQLDNASSTPPDT